MVSHYPRPECETQLGLGLPTSARTRNTTTNRRLEDQSQYMEEKSETLYLS